MQTRAYQITTPLRDYHIVILSDEIPEDLLTEVFTTDVSYLDERHGETEITRIPLSEAFPPPVTKTSETTRALVAHARAIVNLYNTPHES
jgi:hypothetical protein